MLTCTLSASGVCLKRYAMTSCGSAPFFSSSTTRITVVDSSRTSSKVGSFLERMTWAIFSTMAPRSTPNGIDVTMMLTPFLASSSVVHSPRRRTEPEPVSYSSSSSRFEAWSSPPVGKSGPLMKASRRFVVSSRSSIRATAASITSPRLCGGMLVAMPTAMPCAPLTSRFGKRAGRTMGSLRVPS